jgi:glycerol uptake facilitator protein
MTSPILGEFLGTMMLVLLGNGVVAGVLLKRSKAEGGGWPVIAAGWALAVMAGVFTAIACGSNDAHLNPAVTLVFAVRSGHFAPVAPYLAAQLPGGILGAALVWLHYLPRWKETPDASAKLGCFSTSPAIRSLIPNLLSEVIATFALVFVIGAIFSRSVSPAGPAAGRARDSSCRGQRKLRLGLRANTRHRTALGRHACWSVATRSFYLALCRGHRSQILMC